MKEVKLKEINSKKYCSNCEEVVNIKMVGLDGYCPNEISQRTGKYLNKLFTLDTRGEKR